MLMKNECSMIASIKVFLTFDDGNSKERVISNDDLVEVIYNANGLRKHIIGKVVKISAVGSDPKGWYIIVDGSDDFGSEKARFSPTTILDIDIIRKANTLDVIQTPIDETGIPYMRVVKGRYLQWSRDGIRWHTINGPRHHHPIKPAPNPDPLVPDHIIPDDDIIEDDPVDDPIITPDPDTGDDDSGCGCTFDDGIEDAEY